MCSILVQKLILQGIPYEQGATPVCTHKDLQVMAALNGLQFRISLTVLSLTVAQCILRMYNECGVALVVLYPVLAVRNIHRNGGRNPVLEWSNYNLAVCLPGIPW